MSDKKPSVTPKITRTNSLFPASKVWNTPFGPLQSGQSPVIPVTDPRTGQVVGYRDLGGNPVDQQGRRLSDLRTAAQKAAEQRKLAAAQRAGIARYQEAVKASRPLVDNPLSVDGVVQRAMGMTMNTSKTKVDLATGKVTDDAGNDITHSQLGAVAAQQARASAVFSGLNMDDINNAKATFLMSRGEEQALDPATGEKVTPQRGFDDMNSNRRAQEKAHPNRAPQENMMSIQEGIRWLRQLSVKDPQAYNEMVVKLRNAGYINGKDEDLPLNGWSQVVGKAFAYATQDLAGAAEDGEKRTLSEWLDERGKAFVDSMDKADEYKPIDRHYTDPTALAASARSAAEQALGRSLTDAEAAKFAASFKGLEDANYNAIDAAGRAKGSATVTDPNAAGQAEAYIRSPQFDADRGKQLVGTYMDAFKQLVGL